MHKGAALKRIRKTRSQMKTQFEIGMIGLGVMGRNLLLNMADHGHSVAGYDKDAAKVAALRKEARNEKISGAKSLPEFLDLLQRAPRGDAARSGRGAR